MTSAYLLPALAQLLDGDSMGDAGVDLFVGHKPEQPYKVTALFEYDAPAPVLTMGAAATALDTQGVQVVTRGDVEDWQEARNRATLFRDYLGALGGVQVTLTDGATTLATVNIVRVLVVSGVLSLGRDGNNCPEFSANLTAWVEP